MATETLLAGGAMMAINPLLSSIDRSFVESYDFTRNYYTFLPEYTAIIDKILAGPHGIIGSRVMTDFDKYIPGTGYHYFYNNSWACSTCWSYWNYFDYIPVEKFVVKNSGKEVSFYRCYVSRWWPGARNTFSTFTRKIFTIIDDTTIRTYSIDTSAHDIVVIPITKRYHTTPYAAQKGVSDCIIRGYNRTKNMKVLVSGTRGMGKSSVANLVKKALDAQNEGMSCQLFDDFNPAAVGVSVNKHILSQASELSPVIIVINEVDIIMQKALEIKTSFGDTRLCHTESKVTLNGMFDAIDAAKFVIAIYTSEKNHEQIKAQYDPSFIRKGRVDKYITMTKDEFTAIDAV